jgi:hypothetical protein
MKRSLFSLVTASVLLAGASLASAQVTSTTTTWTDEQGNVIRQYSTQQRYNSVYDPALQPMVGEELPRTVTLYPLPETMRVTDPDHYLYTIINDHPVIVERTTRRVVHTWN